MVPIQSPFRLPAGAALLLGAALINVGCYSYVPLAASDVAPGAPVRVNLSDAGSAAVAASVGAFATALDGPVVSLPGDSVLVVTVARLTRRDGTEETWTGEAVRIPRAGVASFEVRRLSRSRTGFLVGATVATSIAVGAALGGGGGFGGRGGATSPGGSR